MIEQLLSNAIKYTTQGTVSIHMEGTHTLVISDTGIGIAPEDLPRIFEKGFTGYNGRTDKKASVSGFISAGVPQTCCHIHCALNLCLTTAQASISVFTQSRRSMTNAALQPSFQKCNIHRGKCKPKLWQHFPLSYILKSSISCAP